MNYFDDRMIKKFKFRIACMYSEVLGISSDKFITELRESFVLDNIDLAILKLLYDAEFDMNMTGTYFLAFILKNKYLEILDFEVEISPEINAEGYEMIIDLGFHQLISLSRKCLAEFNKKSNEKISRKLMEIQRFQSLLNEALKSSKYSDAGYLEFNNSFFIKFLENISSEKPLYEGLNKSALTLTLTKNK